MLNEPLRTRIFHQTAKNLIRNRAVVENNNPLNNIIKIEGKEYINFSSNDYLGLTRHQKVSRVFSKAVEKYGFGSGASALISGYSNEHKETEIRFAEWLNLDKAVLFNAGYLANLGVVSSLVNRSNTIFSDKLCHASLIDGIQLSRAKHYRYKHCNMDHFEQLAALEIPDLIISETVFSMEGDIAPINKLVSFSKKYDANLIIDDAHGIGVLGSNGRGICEHYNLHQNDFGCLILPLGKAFNAMGAIVAGRAEVIDAVIQFARSYRYTTSLPPAVCAALRASLDVVCEEKWRRESLKENIQLFIFTAVNRGLNLISKDETAIKSILFYDNDKVINAQKYLASKGFFVSAIRPPTVPHNTARIRICLNASHSKQQIIELAEHLDRAAQI